MLKIAKQTGLVPEEVIDRASKFFGKGGEGLEEKERNPCCISFEGGGGYVSIYSFSDGFPAKQRDYVKHGKGKEHDTK